MNSIDSFLNKITMYRLVLYGLIAILIFALFFSFLRFLSFSPANLIFSTLFLVFFSGFVNDVFSRVFKAPTNSESVYITALILALIVAPATTLSGYLFLAWLAILSMSSKYILALNKKHIFNPAAIAVVLTALFLNKAADWWVGTMVMAPIVTVVGFLIVRKTRKEDMVLLFLTVAVLAAGVQTYSTGSAVIPILEKLLFSSSLLFFAFVMFTEPLTLPPTVNYQFILAWIVGVLFVPQTHIGTFYFTPELALVIGNIFAYAVSPKEKLLLKVKEKIKISPDTYDFIFPLRKRLSFVPGQYMEWTLPHSKVDSRGNRRYFTIASSPTEDNLRLGIKFYTPASSFKRALIEGNPVIVGSQQAGNFILPPDKQKKLVFMAGGIGITPFRSMLKYLVDTDEKRDIVVYYSNKSQEEIVYGDILEEARQRLGIRTIYTLTDINKIPKHWAGETGRVNENLIRKHSPDFGERLFYLSGPHAMVNGFETVLKKMGVTQIKTDFFPGFV